MYRPLRLQDAHIVRYREELRANRAAVLAQLQRMGFVATGETEIVLHTLTGRIPEDMIAAAQNIPGVRIVRATRHYRLHLNAAVPIIGAPDVWPLLGGESGAGQGIKIGVIDTGIDIANPMLSDSRLTMPAGYPRGDLPFTNSKVIVARTYVGELGDPRDIVDAMDRYGHGTFVAAMAAGRRTVAPLAEITGVAPAAQLGNYRIWGGPLAYSSATDSAIVHAIEDATADGMDVLNLSFGASPADVPAEEPIPQALAAAAKAGVVVVVSAGNGGPYPVSVGDPADSADAIAVGGSSNAHFFGNTLQVLAPVPVADNMKRMAIVPEETYSFTNMIGPANVWTVTGNPCEALPATVDVKNKIVLIADNASCYPWTIVREMAKAGAIAAIFYRSDGEDPEAMYVDEAIPSFQISKIDGQAIAAIPVNGTGQLEIDPVLAAFPVSPERITWFSSRGPNIDGEIKPDLVAASTSVYSALQQNDAYGFLYGIPPFGTADGTSFSAALVSGAAALLKQAHPTWTPVQIKSAMVNTAIGAGVMTDAGEAASVMSSGAGRLDVSRAMQSRALFEPQSLSFGVSVMPPVLNSKRTVRITNTGNDPENYTLHVNGGRQIAGANFVLSTNSFQLKARESLSVDVMFQGSPVVTTPVYAEGTLVVHAGTANSDYVIPLWAALITTQAVDHLWAIRGDGQTAPIGTALPRQVAVQAHDTDHQPLAGVNVTFSVSNGQASLSSSTVTTDRAGIAAVTVTVGNQPGWVEIDATSGTAPTASFIETVRAAPAVASGGVVNAASYSATLAPGQLISIYGSSLSNTTELAGGIPLPTQLGGTQVYFNEIAAPLLYVSPSQINTIVPFELTGQASVELRIVASGSISAATTLALSAAAPGLFTMTMDGRGQVIAQHSADYRLVTAADPARRGETIIVYASGLGDVVPFVLSGQPAPSPAAVTKGTVLVRTGNADARAAFAGLCPGWVGLYQVNVEVPAGAQAGDTVAFALSVNGASSNAATIPIR